MKSEDVVSLISEMFGIAIALTVLVGAVLGYVYNALALAQWTDGMGVLVLRALGVLIAPLGAILGWIA